MKDKDRIATCYCNARELIKQGNPKAARSYVLLILNAAVDTYYSATSILTKAKTAAFLDKWIAVSRDLYDKGITNYVLECFGLPARSASGETKDDKKPSASEREPLRGIVGKEKDKPAAPPVCDGSIDFAGLVDEASETQGWCAELFEANKTAVAEISVTALQRKASGTGFIISENGYLLTNDHVVFDEENGVYFSKIRMSLYGEKKKFNLDVLFSDKSTDVALCKFNPDEVKDFTCVKRIADYSKLKPGADCLVIGNAFGMGLAPFTGVVRFTKNSSNNLVYTAPSNPGDSGGPVFNRNGECIGINKSKTIAVNGTEAEGYANATPMDTVDALLQKWASCNGIKF